MNKKILLFGGGIVAALMVGVWLGMQLAGPTASDASTVSPESESETLPYRAGPFQLAVDIEPQAPVVGENRLRIRLRDSSGEPVEGAGIRAVAEMPAMGAMPAMQAPAEMHEIEPGVYDGSFELSMQGGWPLSLTIRKSDLGEATVGFDMATGRPGLTLASGASPVISDPAATDIDIAGSDGAYAAGPYRLDVRVEPEAPQVGENTLAITLTDAQGQPLSGASIRAVAEMPAMGAMPAMQAPAELREIEPGVYAGPFELSMGGGWPLTLQIEAPGLPVRTVGFDMATGRKGLTPSAGLDGATGSTSEEAPAGTISMDVRRRQLIGVTTALAEVRPLTRSTRAVGRVVYDETRLADVSLKYEAWIGELKADFVGAHVNRGDVLFTVYSPDLYAAQQEYVETFRRKVSPDLLKAARQRLAFWDVDDAFVRELEQRGEPLKYVPIRAPQSGTVVMKNVVEGTAHRAGMTLLRIADLSHVWVEAEIYEADLPLVTTGMPAMVTLPYLPGETIEGKIDYLYPYLQGESRTAKVRLSLPNPDGVLKPDMFADVTLEASLGERLAVPESAVIVSGETRVVFEDLGDGRLAPRIVKTGQRADGWIEVTEGLDAGDSVVTSGNFLIASESRLKAGIKQW